MDKGRAGNVIGFVLAAAVVGALTGLTAGSFRALLDYATQWRTSLSHWSHGSWWGPIVVVAICAVCTAVAASLVCRV